MSALSFGVAFAMLLSVAGSADAATVSGAWRAKIGTGGANGTATISAYTTGTGSLALKLAKLRANTYQPVTLSKGTCGSVGATLIRFPAIRTGSTGAAARTSSLTTSQVTAIRNATRGTGKIALRVGSSTTGGVKCGLFAALPVAPYVAARITVGWGPSDVAVAPNGVWVANWGSNSLSRIDPATNSVLQTVQLTLATQTAGPETLAYGEGSLWVTVTDWDAANNALAGSLLRIDPASGSQLATVPMGRGPIDVAVTPGAVWVAVGADNVVARVDPASNQLVASIPIQEPSGLAGTGDALWVVDRNGKLSRIDPATNQVTTTVQTQDSGGSIVFGGGSLWVTNPGHVGVADGSLTRVDPVSYAVTGKVDVGSHPEDVAFGGGSAWVGMFDDPLVVRVAAANNAVTARVAVGYDVYRLTATATSVWIAQPIEQAPGVVTRLGF